jgi:hypothetical protein
VIPFCQIHRDPDKLVPEQFDRSDLHPSLPSLIASATSFSIGLLPTLTSLVILIDFEFSPAARARSCLHPWRTLSLPLLLPHHYPAPFPYTFPSYPALAPDFIPVPAYGTPSLPSAANYQQPFPFTPLPFLYAAVYPYPPPASAYTPASSFYPAQPYGPSTFSYATTSPCPTSEATPIPTNLEPNWPPPAPEPSPITPTSTPHATSSTPTYDSGQFSPPLPVETPTIAPPGPPDQHPGAPLPTDLSRATQQRLDSIPTITTREHYKHQRLASSKSSDWSFPTPGTKLSFLQGRLRL